MAKSKRSSGVAYVKDVKANATDGGTFTAGAWRTRDLNTLEVDTGTTWIRLSSNQITLQPGTYRIQGRAPALEVDRHQARLYNITTSSTAIVGQQGMSSSTAAYATTLSIIEGTIILTSAAVFEVQHVCQTTAGTVGFGQGNQTLTGDTEVTIFTQVKIEKVG